MLKKIIYTFYAVLIVTSCSEGDVIETNVDFEAPMKSCGNENADTFVFYKIDNTNNQLVSFSFRSTSFSLEQNFDEPVEIPLNNSTNKLMYRKLSAEVDGNQYFCSSVPPAENNIVDELVSENGRAIIMYEKIEGSETMYVRTLNLENITLTGGGITLRKEVFPFGTETFSVSQ